MRSYSYTIFAMVLFAACQPTTPVVTPPSSTPPATIEILHTPTQTTNEVSPTPTQTTNEVSPTPTLLPTETPIAVVKLDKPMTREFKPFDIEVMPSTNEESVRTGQLGRAVMQYWEESGLINPDGRANRPENILAVEPGDWLISISPIDASKGKTGGDMFLTPNWQKYGINHKPSEIPFQPTNLQFVVKDNSGKNLGILITYALYYKDKQGQIKIVPIFFFVEKSKMLATANAKKMDIQNHMIKLFGHTTPQEFSVIPYVGTEEGKTGDRFISYYVNKEALLNESMQLYREVFANQVVENQSPVGIDKFWWGALNYQIKMP